MSITDLVRTALFGDPPSFDYEPSKEALLKAFEEVVTEIGEIDDRVSGLVMGIATYDEVADLPAVTVADNGNMARVFADATASNNTFWIVIGGAWVIDQDFIDLLQPFVDAAEAAAIDAASGRDYAHTLNLMLDPELDAYTAGDSVAWGAITTVTTAVGRRKMMRSPLTSGQGAWPAAWNITIADLSSGRFSCSLIVHNKIASSAAEFLFYVAAYNAAGTLLNISNLFPLTDATGNANDGNRNVGFYRNVPTGAITTPTQLVICEGLDTANLVANGAVTLRISIKASPTKQMTFGLISARDGNAAEYKPPFASATTVVDRAGKIVWISPTGNDTTGTGTFALPWLTLAKARVALRRTIDKTEVGTIMCKDGDYAYETFDLGDAGSGTYVVGDVTIAAAARATVRFIGGATLTGWTATAGRTDVWECAAPANATERGRFLYLLDTPEGLIDNTERHELDRGREYLSPHTGYIKVADVDAVESGPDALCWYTDGTKVYIRASSDPDGESWKLPERVQDAGRAMFRFAGGTYPASRAGKLTLRGIEGWFVPQFVQFKGLGSFTIEDCGVFGASLVGFEFGGADGTIRNSWACYCSQDLFASNAGVDLVLSERYRNGHVDALSLWGAFAGDDAFSFHARTSAQLRHFVFRRMFDSGIAPAIGGEIAASDGFITDTGLRLVDAVNGNATGEGVTCRQNPESYERGEGTVFTGDGIEVRRTVYGAHSGQFAGNVMRLRRFHSVDATSHHYYRRIESDLIINKLDCTYAGTGTAVTPSAGSTLTPTYETRSLIP